MTLSCDCPTKFGEFLIVVGSIEEMGCWHDFSKIKMQWTESKQWVTMEPIRIFKNTTKQFEYKYVIVNYRGDLIRWESGMNRIADLEILPHIEVENAKKVFERVVSSDSKEINQEIMESFKNAKHV